ncbi:MAG: glycosyltransferase [Flavobacteriaceae bacterium]|nr:glycosyltransferase [Flavobacteriaceae bacterium]
MYENKKILVSPLNWGLGHATRCIPIINALIEEGFIPVIASDGMALILLQKEFPQLKYYELPSYNIKYTKDGKNLKYRLLFNSLRIIKSVKNEKIVIDKIIEKERISGIISDNRFGVRSNKIPSIYITHQLHVFSGWTTFLTTRLHQNIISKFDFCWIPDRNINCLSGKLSNIEHSKLDIKYIGLLSRFTYQKVSKKQDLLIMLSGPEPQRSILETKLFKELENYNKKVLFVRGIISDKQEKSQTKNITIVNFMLQDELELAINESELVLARSGYSTIMDLDKLNAKAFFIPTPGQFEQNYLASYLEQKKMIPYSKQKEFTIKMLENIKDYSGFTNNNKTNKVDFKTLFNQSFGEHFLIK